MFMLPVIAFVGGLVAMGRSKPETGVRKILCLGPRSGLVYPVEDFPEIGVVVVRAPNKAAIAQFLRVAVREPGKPGLVYQQGQGDPALLETMRQDFAVPAAPLTAVDGKSEGVKPPSAASSPPAAATPAHRPMPKASTPSGI